MNPPQETQTATPEPEKKTTPSEPASDTGQTSEITAPAESVANSAPDTPPLLPPMEKKSDLKTLLVGVGFLLLLLLLASLLWWLKNPQGLSLLTPEEPPFKTFPTDLYEAIPFNAKAVYIYDVIKDRPLFMFNQEVQLPLASLTKVMTAVIATESLGYDSVISVDTRSLRSEGDSGLYANENWRARDLLDFMLLVSSNDSAYALASAAGAAIARTDAVLAERDPRDVFLSRMNQKAQNLGLSQTYFLNETGLDSTGEVSGGYGSAQDVARLFSYALKNTPQALEATSYANREFISLNNLTHEAENTNEITGRIPGLIASKTGYTALAGGNLVVAFDAGINRPIVIALLGSTREGRFTDMEQLVLATLNTLQKD